jgi:hypothetical protein
MLIRTEESDFSTSYKRVGPFAKTHNQFMIRPPVVDWLTWLNINSGAVSALVSAAVVVITTSYAYLDSGADLDGRSPARACAPVEPQGDAHGVPTH